jgi:hypothetical protein
VAFPQCIINISTQDNRTIECGTATKSVSVSSVLFSRYLKTLNSCADRQWQAQRHDQRWVLMAPSGKYLGMLGMPGQRGTLLASSDPFGWDIHPDQNDTSVLQCAAFQRQVVR